MGNHQRDTRIILGLERLRSILVSELDSARYVLDADIDYSQLSIESFTSDNYEKELIQVAASAVAAILDRRMQYDDSQKTVITDKIIREILEERDRQDTKFPPMSRKLDPLVWLAILFEELGEVAQEIKDE